MNPAVYIIGLLFICCEFTERTRADSQLEGFVRSECRDRYLWIHVASEQTPHFEAVDGHDVHFISEQLASRCGYTISTFKMDGYTTFRASYYSCFTHTQDDKVFTFRFNVMVGGGGGRWSSQAVSAVCSGLTWTHREIICEENYMEVNVNRESSCGGQRVEGKQVWQEAISQAQRTATLAWQLMFLQSDGQVSSMSITEAQRWGYSLTTTTQRVVLRSPYKHPHAEVMMVDGVPVKVVRVSLFFKQKLVVVMMDMSMACTVDSGSFDGAQLLWDVPQVLTPLVDQGAVFESQSFSLGVENVLLDELTATSRGFSMDQEGGLVHIRVPFGVEGGYRKSLVVNNMYKEAYVISLLYEHVFSLRYEDNSSIDTTHRMLRVLDTPLVCRPPFSHNQTVSDQQEFNVYLGNIPADVTLEEVWINGKQMLMSDTAERGLGISPVVHLNGSRAYVLRLPFEDAAVHWMYVGGGVVQYSIDVNFTLTIMPQRDSYFHHTIITARVFNAFPPEITAQCLDGGLSFSVVRPPRTQSLWEVGFDHEPLTSQLVAQRGYRLYNDSHRTTLEVPVFSIGYTYEEVTLSNFYATFKLLLRDSKTLEVQASTSKRCLFRTEDMIVCSADGTMTVVATPTAAWPTVLPERTTLLDRTCTPKQTDGLRVLFEFQLDSCGTRAMVGEWYMVYENEILHDRLLITDGPNFISRESQFRVTARCFYPLSAVNRLSVDRIFRPETPGLGSVEVFKNLKDSANKLPPYDCFHQHSENAIDPTVQIPPFPAAGGVLPHSSIGSRAKPGPSRFITVPAEHNKLLSSPNRPDLSSSPEIPSDQIPQQFSTHPSLWTDNQNVLSSSTDGPFSSLPPRSDLLPDGRRQPHTLTHLSPLTMDFVEVNSETSGLEEYPALDLDSSTHDAPVVEQFESLSGTLASKSLNSLDDSVWHSGLKGDQSTLDQSEIFKQNPVSLNPRQHDKAEPHLSLYGSSGGRMDMKSMEREPIIQPESPQLYPVLEPQDHINSKPLLPSTDKKYVPPDTKQATSKNTGELQQSVSNELMVSDTHRGDQHLDSIRPLERRNVQFGVQNIRVKPLTKYMSSGPLLNQKPVVSQTNSRSFNSSQYVTGSPAVSSGGNHWTPKLLHLTDPDLPRNQKGQRQNLVHARPSQQGQQQNLVHARPSQQGQQQNLVHARPSQQGQQQNLVHARPSQQRQQQTLVQSVAETGNSGGQEFVVGPAAVSHIRVRPDAGLPVRPQIKDSQNPDSVSRGGASRTSSQSPAAGGPGSAGSHTGLCGSSDSNSDLRIQSRSGCGGVFSQFGSSVHRGIIRGELIS